MRASITCDTATVNAVVVAAGSAYVSGASATVEIFFLNPATSAQIPGTCQPRLSLPVPPAANGGDNTVWTIDFGDIDGDDVPDFVTTSRASQQAWGFLGSRDTNGRITYGSAISIPRPDASGSFAFSAALGDLDGDSRDEVAIGAPGTSSRRTPVLGRVVLYKFSGSAFTPTTTLQAPETNDAHWNFAYSVAIGDVTRDGNADVVASALSQTVDGVRGAGAVYVYENGNWESPQQLRAATLADESYGYRVAIADGGSTGGHTGDTWLDVIATTGWGGPDTRLDITLGSSLGLGTTPASGLALRPAAGLAGGWGTGEPTFADVNGDGQLDVFIGAMNATLSSACNSPGVAYAYLSNGSGGMTTYRLAAPNADPDFAGYGRWVVGVHGTPLVLVTEQGRNIDATTEGQIYVYLAPQP